MTNGNVGTLLRLRGLIVPYLVWIGAVGFMAALGTLGQEKHSMRFIDEDGRLFGSVTSQDIVDREDYHKPMLLGGVLAAETDVMFMNRKRY